MDNNEFRIYADESSHLGESPFMVIGAVWCNKNEVRNFTDKIKMLKTKYGIPEKVEIKEIKVAKTRNQKLEDFRDKLANLTFMDIKTPTLIQFNYSSADFAA